MQWWKKTVATPSAEAMKDARTRQLQLTKPPGSLGRLEDLVVEFAGWQARSVPQVERVAIHVFAADHGVVAEGVSAYPQAVTVQMIQNFAAGGAAISVLATHLGTSFKVINVGTATPVPELNGVINTPLAPGTANMCVAAAMSEELLQGAMRCGADNAPEQVDLFIGGEMGIGNTTSAAALTSALLGLPPESTVGRGTGVDDQGLALKRVVVQRALDLHLSQETSVLEMLRRLGGLELAALCGAYIACAQRGVPSLVDGFICTVAALIACRLNPGVRQWMLFAHHSVEPGHCHLLEALDARPLLDLGMRLGEGSGAAIALPLLQAACRLHAGMATFSEAGVTSAGEE